MHVPRATVHLPAFEKYDGWIASQSETNCKYGGRARYCTREPYKLVLTQTATRSGPYEDALLAREGLEGVENSTIQDGHVRAKPPWGGGTGPYRRVYIQTTGSLGEIRYRTIQACHASRI